MQFTADEVAGFSVAAIAIVLLLVYLCLRLGPRRCPNCGKLTWGHFGKPWGPRRMQFHCKRCGHDFQGRCGLGM